MAGPLLISAPAIFSLSNDLLFKHAITIYQLVNGLRTVFRVWDIPLPVEPTNALVESSKTRISECRTRPRAMAIRCLCSRIFHAAILDLRLSRKYFLTEAVSMAALLVMLLVP